MKRVKIGLIVLIAAFLVAVAWAREDRLNSTGLVPAAEGKVITNTDRNGNTEVEVQVKHLAAADKLTPPKQAYLVWVKERDKQPDLLGVLRVNDSLEGSLKATTPAKDFDILVTGEDSLKPELPSDAVVLKGTVQRKE